MSKNNRPSRVFLLFFLVVSVVDIVAILYGNSLWQTLSKPLIIPALIGYYLTSSKLRNKWYVIALFFSFAGDVLLLDKNNLFLFGIGAFLITQVLYVYIFSKGLSKLTLKEKLIAFFPFTLFFVALIKVLYPGLQGFLIPVLVYGAAISVFGSISLLKYLAKRDTASLCLITGAVLFILSDSMIALNKFHQTLSFYPIAIMATYIIAQYLIAVFMLRSEKNTRYGADN